MPTDLVRRYPLGSFWVLAFGFSWAYWIPLAVWAPDVTHFPGLLGPLLAGVLVTSATGGRAALRELGSRMVRWRLPARLWLLSLLPLVAAALAVAVRGLAGQGWPTSRQLATMDGLPSSGFLVLLGLVLVVNGYGEEVGWRGVAWARLRSRFPIAPAALRLALPWAVWHLPTFWLDTGLRGFPLLTVPGWLVGLFAGAVVLGWLYEKAGASLLIVAVFHSGLNLASATQATEGLPAAAATAVVIAVAVLVLRSETHRLLSGSSKVAAPV